MLLDLIKRIFNKATEHKYNYWYNNPYVFILNSTIYVVSYDSSLSKKENLITQDIMNKVYSSLQNHQEFSIGSVADFYLDLNRMRNFYHQSTFPNNNEEEFYKIDIKSDNSKINLTYHLVKL